MNTEFANLIWDQIAQARDLTVTPVADNAVDATYRYRCSFDLVLDRTEFALLRRIAKGPQGRRGTQVISAYVARGFKWFFRESQPEYRQ